MGAKLSDMYQRGETLLDKDRRASNAAAFDANNPKEGAEGPPRSPLDGGSSLPDAMTHRESHSEMEKADK